jgi:hypothetical protein
MHGSAVALGFAAKTGTAIAVAMTAAPELVGRWELLLAPPAQERFVYHAAQALGDEAEAWVRHSERAIGQQTLHAIDRLLADLGATPAGGAIVGSSLDQSTPLADVLASHTRVHTAEGVLYRVALADALHARAIDVTLVPAADLAPAIVLDALGKVAPPWRREHKDAARAALALLSRGRADARASGTRTARGDRRRQQV